MRIRIIEPTVTEIEFLFEGSSCCFINTCFLFYPFLSLIHMFTNIQLKACLEYKFKNQKQKIEILASYPGSVLGSFL